MAFILPPPLFTSWLRMLPLPASVAVLRARARLCCAAWLVLLHIRIIRSFVKYSYRTTCTVQDLLLPMSTTHAKVVASRDSGRLSWIRLGPAPPHAAERHSILRCLQSLLLQSSTIMSSAAGGGRRRRVVRLQLVSEPIAEPNVDWMDDLEQTLAILSLVARRAERPLHARGLFSSRCK